jgi:UDP-hydrolysing UDP-N-acetyl-D-glucosamine 2-epimerase
VKKPLVVCAISGGRADYGLLASPLRSINADPAFVLKVVLTGQHLDRAAGETGACVRADGLDVFAEVDMGLGGDDAATVTKAAARALDGMADVLLRLSPDIVLLAGDRYEILCCAIAAAIARVPIAHIAGGDVTEGAFDDAFRHAITKLAHLHFVTSEPAARRVRQLGEQADRIYVVGSPGIDLIRTTPVPSRDAFFGALGLEPKRLNLIVTFHPVTLADDSVAQLDEMLEALATFDDAAILFTGSNADPEGRKIEQRIRQFVQSRRNARYVPSLGAERYFGALVHMDAMVGNSSSGLYEAPSFGIPTVNIGYRQKGRLRAESVFDSSPHCHAIRSAIDAALARGRRPTANPYGDGHASEGIVAALRALDDPRCLLVKSFVDIAVA